MATIQLTNDELRTLRNMLVTYKEDVQKLFFPEEHGGREYRFAYEFFAPQKERLDSIFEKVWKAQFD